MMGRRKRPKVEPTDDWRELLTLFEWPEQRAYEELRPMVLFGVSVAGRARETGTPERTMYRRVERFERDGMLSLFATDPAAASARRQGLEPHIRRMIVELKAEHPKLNDNEITNIVYVRTGRRLGDHTVARPFGGSGPAEALAPLRALPRDRGRQGEARGGGSWAGGWRRARRAYRPPGRPKDVRKVDLATMDFIRRSQENPELGAFRVHAALVQKRGAEASMRTVGRVMVVHREALRHRETQEEPPPEKSDALRGLEARRNPSADVRYIKKHRLPVEGYLYIISILENYSRKILASAVCQKQDVASFLPVLHSAVGRYGSPETFVTDSGSVFLTNRAQGVYEAQGMEEAEIEKGRPWQGVSPPREWRRRQT